jgi:hypothetical protein
MATPGPSSNCLRESSAGAGGARVGRQDSRHIDECAVPHPGDESLALEASKLWPEVPRLDSDDRDRIGAVADDAHDDDVVLHSELGSQQDPSVGDATASVGDSWTGQPSKVW